MDQSSEYDTSSFSLLIILGSYYAASLLCFCSQSTLLQLSAVQCSHSVVSDSLRPDEPEHTRPPCLSPTPGVHPNPSPSSPWCHPTISSSVVPCPQSFAASGGQSIGVSASTSVLSMNTQDWSPLGCTGWISPCTPRDSQESSPTPQFKSINYSALSFLHSPTLTSVHDYWKNHSLD